MPRTRRAERGPWIRCFASALPLAFLAALLAVAASSNGALVPPGGARAPSGLAEGRLLVADPDLSDPNFAQTVVLLLGYDEHGAMGVIVNRRTNVALTGVFPGAEELEGRDDTVYLGGPVGRDRVVVLLRSSEQPRLSRSIVDGVWVTSSLETLWGHVARGGAKAEFRVYAGYAGWGPGQLEAEVARGDWRVTGADAEIVFHPQPSEVWRKLVDRVSGEWARGSTAPAQIVRVDGQLETIDNVGAEP